MNPNVDADSGFRAAYRNDPIVEAIVEFTFATGADWDITLPGRIYDRLRFAYPDAPKQQETFEAGITQGTDTFGTFELNRRGSRVVFGNANRLLMVGANILSIHSLKPYEGWKQLLPRVTDALETYVATAHPRGLAKISLRYINRIDIPRDSFSLTDYFTVTQGLPEAFPSQLKSFVDRMELAYDDIPGQIIFTWATAKPVEQGHASFVLDLDLSWTEECQIGEALGHLQDLHTREREAFESLINDNLREIFDADQ